VTGAPSHGFGHRFLDRDQSRSQCVDERTAEAIRKRLLHALRRDLEIVVAELNIELDLVTAYRPLVREGAKRPIRGERDLVPGKLAVLDRRLILRTSNGTRDRVAIDVEREGVSNLPTARYGEFRLPLAAYVRRQRHGRKGARDDCNGSAQAYGVSHDLPPPPKLQQMPNGGTALRGEQPHAVRI